LIFIETIIFTKRTACYNNVLSRPIIDGHGKRLGMTF